LNQLDSVVKKYVETKQLDMGHARTLLILDTEHQADAAKVIVDKKMTVRQAEQYVKRLCEPKKEVKKVEDSEANVISERLSQCIGSAVSLTRHSNGQSKMTITFDKPHKLEELIKLIESSS
jgi:ParB family chromosome partitioning protein